MMGRNEFLLTRPLRDVTERGYLSSCRSTISTHTPLAGRDTIQTLTDMMIQQFLLTRPLRDVTQGYAENIG